MKNSGSSPTAKVLLLASRPKVGSIPVNAGWNRCCRRQPCSNCWSLRNQPLCRVRSEAHFQWCSHLISGLEIIQGRLRRLFFAHLVHMKSSRALLLTAKVLLLTSRQRAPIPCHAGGTAGVADESLVQMLVSPEPTSLSRPQ